MSQFGDSEIKYTCQKTIDTDAAIAYLVNGWSVTGCTSNDS